MALAFLLMSLLSKGEFHAWERGMRESISSLYILGSFLASGEIVDY